MPIRCKPMPIPTPEQEERFWSRIEKRGESECWPWTAKLDGWGYGIIWIGTRNIHANRLAYFLTNGVDPGDSLVLHMCENMPGFIGPHCCNPAHLKAGTHEENMAHTRGKPRKLLQGEKHGKATLTDTQAIEILHRRKSGERAKDLAAEYGVGVYTVSNLCCGNKWLHLHAGETFITKAHSGRQNLSQDEVKRIFELRKSGLPYHKIGAIVGMATSCVERIINGKHYKRYHELFAPMLPQ